MKENAIDEVTFHSWKSVVTNTGGAHVEPRKLQLSFFEYGKPGRQLLQQN